MILHILGFACLAHLFADVAQYFEWQMKPFQCNMCMGFWLSIIPFIPIYGLEAPLISAITGITSEIIYRIINRI